jgi:RNA polymerase-associated protein
MALIANRKSVMTLFSDRTNIHSHRVRLVLAEKGINYEVIYVDPANPPEDLLELNPYGMVPTLVDRELVLYDSQVIMEFLDERFPHPPLMPVDPVSRGRSRMTLRRIQKDWDTLVELIENGSDTEVENAKKEMTESLTVVSPIFEQKLFFMNDEFSLMDCAVAPILWRLPLYGVELAPEAKLMAEYAERMFELENFQASLSEQESEMR